MCCGSGTIKQTPSEVVKSIEVKAKVINIAKTPSISKAVKEQLIINQQLLRLNKKP